MRIRAEALPQMQKDRRSQALENQHLTASLLALCADAPAHQGGRTATSLRGCTATPPYEKS